MVGAALELWLRTDSAEAITASIATRLDKLRIIAWAQKSLIANSVTLTVIVLMLLCTAMMAAMIAVIVFLHAGFNHRVIDAVLGVWPLYAFIAGHGVLWLIFYHAGADPAKAIDKLFSWGAIGGIGFVAGAAWMAYPELSSQSKHNAQRDFHKAILSAPVPCVTVQDKLSDLSACAVFRLRPGMKQGEGMNIVNSSG